MLQRLDFVKAELQIEYSVDNPLFQDWRRKDIEHHSKAEKILNEFEEKRSVSTSSLPPDSIRICLING